LTNTYQVLLHCDCLIFPAASIKSYVLLVKFNWNTLSLSLFGTASVESRIRLWQIYKKTITSTIVTLTFVHSMAAGDNDPS